MPQKKEISEDLLKELNFLKKENADLKKQISFKQEVKSNKETTTLSNEKKAQSILAALPDLVFVIDKDGVYHESFTQEKEKLAGNPDKVVGSSLYDVFEKKEANAFLEKIQNSISSKSTQVFSYRLEVRGIHYHFEARISALNDSQALSIVRDVSERKRVEGLLKESEDRFRTITDYAFDMISLLDVNSYFLYCNIAHKDILGYSPDDLIGGSIFDIVHPDDKADLMELFRQRICKTRTRVLFFLRLACKDASYKIVELRASFLADEQGNIQNILVIANDISDRKEAELRAKKQISRINAIIKTLPDLIFVLDKRGYYKEFYANDKNLYPFPVENVIGTHLSEELSKEFIDIKGFIEAFQECLDTEEPQMLEFPLSIKNQHFIFEARITPFDDYHLVTIIRDITERKHLYALEQEVAIARKSMEFKQNFIANMSHEIRTPLTGVMGMVEVLRKTQLSKKQKDFLDTLKMSAKNLSGVIDMILDYSNLEAGRVKTKEETFAIQDLFAQAEMLFSNITTKPLEYSSFIANELPAYILSDSGRVNQIIHNFLYNAVKFTDEGSIKMQAILSDKEGNPLQSLQKPLYIKISVSDTGKGISEQEKKHLFIPFSQIEFNSTRGVDGTGLGLSICKELTHLLEGKIGVESTAGKGSTFWFTFKALPMDDPNQQESDKIQIEPSGKGLHILLVEDKIVNQKVLKLILATHGHTVTVANNGKEAVDIFKQDLFDAILMDIQMPVMDGVTATQKLKASYDQLPPIIGLSANAFEGDREKYIELGMDEYLTKPLDEDAFHNVLRKFEL